MRRKPKVGLLPLYLKLYDEIFPQLRNEFEPLLRDISAAFTNEGVEPVRGNICRQEHEIRQVIQFLQKEDIDLLVTIHLAYSLSLEAIPALSEVSCPILLLDTTMDYSFDQNVNPERLMMNHGIHGVQDLACMLRRKKIPFEIVAGSIQHSGIMQRATGIAKAAYGVRCWKQSRVLRIGNRFEGMGDFILEESVLHNKLGISVSETVPASLKKYVEDVTDQEIEEVIHQDRTNFEVSVSDEVHRRSVRVGLGLRRLLEEEQYTAFSFNFQSFHRKDAPVDTVPFLEASKSMARGIGYAGEGDVLTASFVGALASAFGRTTFTEIFCPDWKHNALFLSHMGEINPEVSVKKPLLCEKEFPWTEALNPAILACAPAPGLATFVNIAPGPDDSFRLILCPVDVLEDSTNPAFRTWVRGWIRPRCSVPTFLEEYSRAGGTHHSALILGEWTEALSAFARFAGIERIRIGHE